MTRLTHRQMLTPQDLVRDWIFSACAHILSFSASVRFVTSRSVHVMQLRSRRSHSRTRVVFFRFSTIMGESSDVLAKRSGTDSSVVKHRRPKAKDTGSSTSSSTRPACRPSFIASCISYFTRASSDRIDVSASDEKKKKGHERISRKGSCFPKHLCCKLLLLVLSLYLIMFLRPDYGIYLRNSLEAVLKKFNLTSPEFQLRPGQRLAQYRQPSMPIIIIPGIISTGLELWRGLQCADGKFRHRFWTSMQMVDNIGRDHQCWLKHISLNLSTW